MVWFSFNGTTDDMDHCEEVLSPLKKDFRYVMLFTVGR